MSSTIIPESTACLYVADALKAYRHVTYGQFDQESRHVVPLTQDGAKVIRALVAKLQAAEDRLRDVEELARAWHSKAAELPENQDKFTASILFRNSARILRRET